MSLVSKYIAVVRVGLSGAMEYRLNFIINTVLTVVISTSVQMFLWYAVYQSSTHKDIAGMSLNAMLMYLVCSVMCFSLTRNSMREREQAETIRTGRLNGFLVKPISHALYTFSLAVAERIPQTVFVILPSLCLLVPLSLSLHVPLSVEGTLVAIPLLILGGVINFLMGLFISYMAFWLDEVWTFHAMKDISMTLLSGMVFPLSVLPSPWREISEYLPFQYTAYIPASLMNGSINVAEAPLHLLKAAVWTGVCVLLVALIWRLGLKRYSAFGG